MNETLTPPSLGLYVHLPWCVRKCPYCDFNSHALRGELPGEEYVAALLADLEAELPLAWGRSVSSVYFGGGTPSLFSAALMNRLLAGIRARLPLAPDVEVTLEANPGTIERGRFSDYAAAGINRVSLGAQTFDDQRLAAIGRIHGRADIDRSVASLQESGIERFNIDLMYGLPGQSVEQAVADVEAALATGAEHVSHYQLTLEPNTAFAVDPPQLPEEETCWDMQESTSERLAGAGLEQYEVSAWARPGEESRHNLNYWRFGDYLGIGAGAHAKLTDAARPGIQRRIRQRHPATYLAGGDRIIDAKWLTPEEARFEFFLNGLRLREGVDQRRFEQRTGQPWSAIEPVVQAAVNEGLLERTNTGVKPSALGWRFLNDLQARFLP